VTAAGLGVDLSCAAHALFAELPPDAAWLNQVTLALALAAARRLVA